jgi:hypothetical protein
LGLTLAMLGVPLIFHDLSVRELSESDQEWVNDRVVT